VDSVLAQSLDDIEVLCVDDGSTDGSAEILERAARGDSRLTVLRQPNTGAGAARNHGLARARGDYLSFLDADDLFEPRMLEVAHTACVHDDADVGVYDARTLDSDTGRVAPAYVLKTEHLPAAMPFSYVNIPDHILDFTSPAPWNKLFKHAFVSERGLRFQEIRRANDFAFTKLALVLASRITVVDERLVYYRVGSQSNLQSNNDLTPLEFHEAHVALKTGLIESGVFSEVERGFVNLVLANCLYNLHSLRTADSFDLLYGKMRDEYFSQMGIEGRDPTYFFSSRQYEQYLKIMELEPEGYLLDEVHTLRGQVRERNEKLAASHKQLKRLKSSTSYRVARAMTYLPRKLRGQSSPGKES
jgi:glycosyltransferase involved in cell wall biosynthesis